MRNKNFIGCSGFSESLWKGFFYPEDLPRKDYLTFYASEFNAVEINSTFYRTPRKSTLQRWYDETPNHFRFIVKAHKFFTHTKRMQDCNEELQVFSNNVQAVLQEKLSGILYQLPPSFKFSNENMERFLLLQKNSYFNVVEFRDASWWKDEVFEFLRAHNIIFSGVSFPKNLPDAVIKNSDDCIYHRLHGAPELFKSEYSEEFLDDLAKQLSDFKGEKFVFFNNTFGIAGVKNALYLNKILK